MWEGIGSEILSEIDMQELKGDRARKKKRGVYEVRNRGNLTTPFSF
jgi:hypothetical protein